MKKKGFTLIELLAVIVILAVIALIATPLVLKYIEYSKEKSAKISANTYAEAVEKEYVSKLTSNEKIPNGTYSIEQLDGYGVKVKGDKPEGTSDYVVLNNGNVIEYELTIKGYVITYKDGNVTVGAKDNVNSNCMEMADHTVKFMFNDKPFQISSVTDGAAVYAPTINPTKEGYYFKHWITEDNVTYTYPFIPTEDVELFAEFAFSYTEILYSHFGVDKSVYPYVFIEKDASNYIRIFFATSYSGTYISASSGYYMWTQQYKITSEDNFPTNSNYGEVVNFVVNKLTPTLNTSKGTQTVRSDYVIWTNVDFTKNSVLTHVTTKYYIGD